MPGIYGIAAPSGHDCESAINRMCAEAAACRDARRFEYHTVRSGRFAAFVMNNRTFENLKHPYEDDDIAVLFDGVIFNLPEICPSARTYAEAAACLYRSHGQDFPRRVFGHFVMALLDKRTSTLRIYNDIVSTKPLYYMPHKGALFFASELKALLPVGPLPKHADIAAMRDILHMGYVMGVKTLVREVGLLEQGGMLEFRLDSGALRKKRYYRISARRGPLERKTYIHRLRESFARACRQVFRHTSRNGYSILVTLSGGRDSRLIMAEAHRDGRGIAAVTYGTPGTPEMDYAACVCENLGARQMKANLGRGEWLPEYLDRAVTASEGMGHFADAANLTLCLDEIDPCRYGLVNTGYIQDGLFGKAVRSDLIHLPPPDMADPDHFRRMETRLAFSMHPEGTRMLLNEAGAEKDDAVFRDSLAQAVESALPGAPNWTHATDRLIFSERFMRGSFSGLRAINEQMDFACPCMDPETFECAMSVPHEWKADQAFYIDYLHAALPKSLKRIPNTGNYGPLRKSVALMTVERTLKVKFFHGILARLDPDWRRKYGSHQQYSVLVNARLRHFIADHLSDFPRARVMGFRPARWRSFLGRWRRNPRPHIHYTQQLFWLLFLKRFFDLWGKYISI